MTNAEIISGACLVAGITEDVDTFAGWKRHGYSVKKGEKAAFITKIWKISKVKVEDDDTESTEKKYEKKFILVNAGFFKQSQVEKLEAKDNG